MPANRGKQIPPAIKVRTERRILDHAANCHPGKFARVAVRFQGTFCYIDTLVNPQDRDGSDEPTPMHLCRIRYLGHEDHWSFAFYTYAHERYEPSFLLSGNTEGTPEEAFDTSTLFY